MKSKISEIIEVDINSVNAGFWVRLWMEYGKGHTKTKDTYTYLKYEDGYTKEDEEFLRSLAHDWAQYDEMGFNLDRYSYGFEIVARPPDDWLEKELKSVIEEIKLLKFKLKLIRSELIK